MECSVHDCDYPAQSAGMCSTHYGRNRRLGSPTAGGLLRRRGITEVRGVRWIPHRFVPLGFLVEAGHLGQAFITRMSARPCFADDELSDLILRRHRKPPGMASTRAPQRRRVMCGVMNAMGSVAVSPVVPHEEPVGVRFRSSRRERRSSRWSSSSGRKCRCSYRWRWMLVRRRRNRSSTMIRMTGCTNRFR